MVKQLWQMTTKEMFPGLEADREVLKRSLMAVMNVDTFDYVDMNDKGEIKEIRHEDYTARHSYRVETWDTVTDTYYHKMTSIGGYEKWWKETESRMVSCNCTGNETCDKCSEFTKIGAKISLVDRTWTYTMRTDTWSTRLEDGSDKIQSMQWSEVRREFPAHCEMIKDLVEALGYPQTENGVNTRYWINGFGFTKREEGHKPSRARCTATVKVKTGQGTFKEQQCHRTQMSGPQDCLCEDHWVEQRERYHGRSQTRRMYRGYIKKNEACELITDWLRCANVDATMQNREETHEDLVMGRVL